MNHNAENPLKQSWGMKFVSLVPYLVLVVVVTVSIINMLPTSPALRWGGYSLTAPVEAERHFADPGSNEWVFETAKPMQIVRAAFGGTVSIGDRGLVTISNGPAELQYRGISVLDVQQGQVVAQGARIGRLFADKVPPFGRLTLKLLQNGGCIPPTARLESPNHSPHA